MRMINLKYSFIALFAFIMTGCDFMDCDESSDYTKEDIAVSYQRSKQIMNNVYRFLPNGFCNIDGAISESATDDAVHVYKNSNIQRFVDGTWSPDHTVDDQWSNYYEGIRAANIYLKDFANLSFDDWKYNDLYDKWMKEYGYYQYEVRFLRAFFYFELIKRYRNVPLVTDVLTVDEANLLKPSSFDDVAQFILDECNFLIEERKLPVNFKDGFLSAETGRVTLGAVMAFRSRVCLYLASPLYSADNKDKWKDAAKEAYALMGQASELGYGLSKYADLFKSDNNLNQENILVRPVGENSLFETANFPIGVTGGKTSTCPTENLVSAYETIGGEPFDWDDEKMKSNPYAGRDPRLEMTIAYNDMAWPKNKLEIWTGGANALPLSNATVTGYYLKKYVNKDISFDPGSTVTKKHHNWILFRYAEVLLNYAEAMVHAFGSPTYTDNDDFPMSALDAVNMVRQRSDVNMSPYPSSISSEDFVTRLKNERRVELAFEGHRFWDVRRWKELDKTAEIYKVSVSKVGDEFQYEKQLYEQRIVKDCMYFYPISNTELFKNTHLLQTPNW